MKVIFLLDGEPIIPDADTSYLIRDVNITLTKVIIEVDTIDYS